MRYTAAIVMRMHKLKDLSSLVAWNNGNEQLIYSKKIPYESMGFFLGFWVKIFLRFSYFSVKVLV